MGAASARRLSLSPQRRESMRNGVLQLRHIARAWASMVHTFKRKTETNVQGCVTRLQPANFYAAVDRLFWWIGFVYRNEGKIYVEPLIFKGGCLMTSDALAPVR